MLVEYSKVK